MPRTPTGRPPGRPRKEAPEPATAPEPAVAGDGDICGECWPDGWPAQQVGSACSHGQWYRDESARPWQLPVGGIAVDLGRPTTGQVAQVIAAMTDSQLGDLMNAVQQLKNVPPAPDIPGTDLTDPSLQE